MSLSSRQHILLMKLFKVWQIDQDAFVSFHKGHFATLRSLRSKGLAELDCFIGYRITQAGRDELGYPERKR